ncbi:MAG: hypothetical protein Q9216_004923, partial [Gyalolechia sp. 2 TL-2023]
FVDVQTISPELGQQCAAEVGGVGYVGDFVQSFGEVDGNELSETGKLDMWESLGRHGPEFLPVGPDFAVGDSEEIYT